MIANIVICFFFRQRKNNLGHLLKMETVTDTHTHTEYIININCYFLVTVSIIWTHFGALLWKLSWQLSQFELCYFVCSTVLNLILQHTVMHILLYLIFCSLYLIFYAFYFMYTSLVLYFSIFALSMERTRLTFHCWLYNLCIVVYVTNTT